MGPPVLARERGLAGEGCREGGQSPGALLGQRSNTPRRGQEAAQVSAEPEL